MYGRETWRWFVLICVYFATITQAADYPATVVKTQDGDALTVDIDLGFSVQLQKQVVRMLDYDAWESKRYRHNVHIGEITDAEIEKGKKAHAALNLLIEKAKTVTVSANTTGPLRDRYGRLLVHLVIDGKPAAATLKAAGHCRPMTTRAFFAEDSPEDE